MPKLNDNEKRLMTILGVGVFIIANVLGYFLLSDVMKNMALEEGEVRTRLNDLEKAKAKVEEADAKRQWMDEHLKAPASEDARDTYLDTLVNGSLISGLDVELSKTGDLPTLKSEYFIKTRFRITAKGPWPDVKEFIYRLQQPEEFRFVPRLSMVPKKSEDDDSVQLVEVSLEIEKWWPNTGGPEESAAAPLAEIEQPAADGVQPGIPENTAAVPATPPPADTPAPPPAPASADSTPAPSPPSSPEATPATPTADNSTKPTL